MASIDAIFMARILPRYSSDDVEMARARDDVQCRETIIVIAERYQSPARHRHGSMKSWVWDRDRRYGSKSATGELWLEAFAAERGATDGTLKAYGEYLDFPLRFLGERGLTVGEVTQDIIRDYLGYLGSIGYADKTIEGHRAVVRARAARTKVPHLLIGGKGDEYAAPPDAADHTASDWPSKAWRSRVMISESGISR